MPLSQFRSAMRRLETMDVPLDDLWAVEQYVTIESTPTDERWAPDIWHADQLCAKLNEQYPADRKASVGELYDADPQVCSCLMHAVESLAEWLDDLVERLLRATKHTDATTEAITSGPLRRLATYGELHARLRSWPSFPRDTPQDIQEHFANLRILAEETYFELHAISDQLLDADLRSLLVFDLDRSSGLNAAFVGQTDIWHAWVDSVRYPEDALAAALVAAGADRTDQARTVVAQAEAAMAHALDTPHHMVWARDLSISGDAVLEGNFDYEIYALLLLCGLPGQGDRSWHLLDYVPAAITSELNHHDACLDLGERDGSLDATAIATAMLTLTEAPAPEATEWRAAYEAARLLMLCE